MKLRSLLAFKLKDLDKLKSLLAYELKKKMDKGSLKANNTADNKIQREKILESQKKKIIEINKIKSLLSVKLRQKGLKAKKLIKGK